MGLHYHSRPQRPRSFWSAPRIATPGQTRFSEQAQSIRYVFSANRIWTSPEVAFLGADQKKRGLWRREWVYTK